MILYCYRLSSPIDFWFGALTEKQLLETIDFDLECGLDITRQLVELVVKAQRGFKRLRWEGDISSEHFFALPNDGSGWMDLGYVIKQENNGDCFVASPRLLPWLCSEYDFCAES